MVRAAILIPYKPSDEWRVRSYEWVKRRYEGLFPEMPVYVGLFHEEPFSRSRAVNLAARRAGEDVYIISDADMWCEPKAIGEALRLLEHYAWVLPYRVVNYLTPESTQRVLALDPLSTIEIDAGEVYKRRRKSVGGMLVVTRHKFWSVGGMDERFVDWGAEDKAFAAALDTLCGRHVRVDTAVYHLWHPRPRRDRQGNAYYQYNKLLRQHYEEAAGNRLKMLELINERDWL